MFLITSGAYIEQEFVSEIGLLPPSFLPLGNRCLFEYQIPLARKQLEKVYLSIPASFELSNLEQEVIEACDVELIPIPDGLTLGDSIRHSIEQTGRFDEPLHILHGDTLFRELPVGQDLLTNSRNAGYYQRAVVCTETSVDLLETRQAVDCELVASGYFSFADTRLFTQLLDQSQGDFITAINQYHCQQPLTTVIAKDWYDFGHINAYFNSRAAFTTERSFNALEISPSTVSKTSELHNKMQGEAHWFTHLPASIQIYTPKLIEAWRSHDYERESCGYTLEYLYNLPLSDLFVFGRLEKETWRSIFQSCRNFLDLCGEIDPRSLDELTAASSYDQLYLAKTNQRLEQFAKTSLIDLDQAICLNRDNYPSLRLIAEQSAKLIRKTSELDIGIVHGDFCFSNILYDFRIRRIKVIDPRGIDHNGRATLLGDRRYDLAKLYHSVSGLYDLIIAGRLKAYGEFSEWELRYESNSYQHGILEVFDEVFFTDRPQLKQEVHAISIQLFLSMLPLHSDRPERQKTMLANAVRLYEELIRGKRCL